MLVRLVMAGRDTEDGDGNVLAEIKMGWVNQRSNVFDEEQIDVREVQESQGVMDVCRIRHTLLTGIDLDDLAAGLRDAVGVTVRRDVAGDDADSHIRSEALDGSFDQRGFPAAGAAIDADGEDARCG